MRILKIMDALEGFIFASDRDVWSGGTYRNGTDGSWSRA